MSGGPGASGGQTDASPARAGSIYVLSDDEDHRATLQGLVADRFRGIVRGFRSAAVFLAEAYDLEPGIVLIDGGAGGVAFLRASAGLGDRFVTVVLSDRPSVAEAVEAMKAGAADYLETPFAPARLVSAVDGARSRLGARLSIAERERQAKAGLAKLSTRETEVLKGLIDGRPNKEIAQDLQLSPRTVEVYRANLMEKLGVRSLSEALRLAFAAGLFPET